MSELKSLIKSEIAQTVDSRALLQAVDDTLKAWGRSYFYQNKREIMKETGVRSPSGDLANSRNSRPSALIPFNEDRFDAVNGAIQRMPVKHSAFLHRHYVIDDDRPENRNGEKVKDYIKRIGVSRSTYNYWLRQSKLEAVARGIFG